MVDKNKFFAELDTLGREKAKIKVRQNAYSKKELRLVQEWFRTQPNRDFKTWVYHPLKDGKIVMFSEAIDLYKHGWVDGPHELPPGLRGLWLRIISYSKLQVFLLWRDKECKTTTEKIALTVLASIGGLWTFPLGNLAASGEMPAEVQRIIRVIGTLLLIGIGVTTLLVLSYKRYKKYRAMPSIDNADIVKYIAHTKK